eukprot:1042309-Prorocentrum_minimum.AAC.2
MWSAPASRRCTPSLWPPAPRGGGGPPGRAPRGRLAPNKTLCHWNFQLYSEFVATRAPRGGAPLQVGLCAAVKPLTRPFATGIFNCTPSVWPPAPRGGGGPPGRGPRGR